MWGKMVVNPSLFFICSLKFGSDKYKQSAHIFLISLKRTCWHFDYTDIIKISVSLKVHMTLFLFATGSTCLTEWLYSLIQSEVLYIVIYSRHAIWTSLIELQDKHSLSAAIRNSHLGSPCGWRQLWNLVKELLLSISNEVCQFQAYKIKP